MAILRRSAAFVCGAIAAISLSVWPQEKPSVATSTSPNQPAQSDAPQHEQVHTGVSSGLDTEARIEGLLRDHQFARIEAELNSLPSEQAQIFRGILLNRDNDPQKSAEVLAPLIDSMAASGNVALEKAVRKSLAEDYLRMGDMVSAARAYDELAERLHDHLNAQELDEMELPMKLAPLAAENPSMIAEPFESFILPVSRDALGLTDVPVYVDARPHSWMLDPTAPFNLIARSSAKEAGLKISADSVMVKSLSGRAIPLHVTLIPRFTIGGRITFHNVTAFVFDDADYAFPKSGYQVQGVLGYPALHAVGSLTISSNETIEMRPAATDTASEGARFYLDGEQIIVALGAAGKERMYALDASGQQTYLTSRYFDEHEESFATQKPEPFTLPETQSIQPQPAYSLESVPLTIGSMDVNAHFIRVLTQTVGSSAIDDVYGVLGMDFLDEFKSYTFDYGTMRFSVRTE